MPLETLTRRRVSVFQDPYCYVVAVDSIPVLRCQVRREAMRYAVLIRRALRRALDGALPGGRRGSKLISPRPK